MVWYDSVVSIGILVIIALIIYSKYQRQTLIETLKGIKEAIQELKPESSEYEWEYQ